MIKGTFKIEDILKGRINGENFTDGKVIEAQETFIELNIPSIGVRDRRCNFGMYNRDDSQFTNLTLTINSMNNDTNALNVHAEKHMNEKQKKLYKAGLILGDYTPTSFGMQTLKDLLFLEKEVELVKVAEKIISEQEKADKC